MQVNLSKLSPNIPYATNFIGSELSPLYEVSTLNKVN